MLSIDTRPVYIQSQCNAERLMSLFCLGFKSWQHLRSYQNGHCLVTMCMDGDESVIACNGVTVLLGTCTDHLNKENIIYMYMESSLPKCVKRQSKNRCCNVKFGEHVWEKSSSYMCTYIRTCEKLFDKNAFFELGLALQAHFLEWRLARFGKDLFIYIFIYAYPYHTHMYRDTYT